MQCAEIRQLMIIERHDLAVEDAAGECACLLCDGAEALGPIKPRTRADHGLAFFYVELRAIAVEFDFVRPTRAIRRPRHQFRQLWFDEFGHCLYHDRLDALCFAGLRVFRSVGLSRACRGRRLFAAALGAVAVPYRVGLARRSGREHERLGPPSFAVGNLLHRAAGGDRAILAEHGLAARVRGVCVAMLDQQPIGALAAELIAAHAHQDPTALELVTLQREFQIARLQCVLGAFHALGNPEAAVPQHDGAAAVLTLRNRAFEVAVVERMILHFHGQALVGRIQRGPAGDGPGFEDAVPLQAKVVVQLSRGMLLHHKAQSRGGGYALLARRLLGFREVAFGAVNGKRRLRHVMRLDPSCAGRPASGAAMPWDPGPARRDGQD